MGIHENSFSVLAKVKTSAITVFIFPKRFLVRLSLSLILRQTKINLFGVILYES